MAVEKGKVLAAIEAKFKGKSLTKNFKENLATKWADKIENDEGIDAYIEDREDTILEASNEADRRATQAAQRARQEAADAAAGKKPGEEDKSKTPTVPEDAPEWAKALVNQMTQQNQKLQEEISAFKTARQTESLADRFKKDERLKGIPEFALKGYIPTKEEDFETAVTSLATEYGEFAKTNKLGSFGKDAPPAPPAGGGGKQDEKPDPAVEAFAKSQNDKFINSQKS